LDQLLHDCHSAFPSEEIFARGRRHVLSQLVGFGRHTISGLLRTQARHQRDWSADYRFYSEERFDASALFATIRQKVETRLKTSVPLVVAMDDSLLRKSGRKIHGLRYHRDPMSPPFAVNFVRGLRVLQISAAVPQQEGAARLVPVDFHHAVLPPKPPRKASDEELVRYRQERAALNINKVGAQRLLALRQQMDQGATAARPLVATVDGRFTNGTLFQALPERTTLIGRVRKDAKLYAVPVQQLDRGRKRKYGERAPTPQQLLDDDKVPWVKVKAFACGKTHEFEVKRLGPLVAPMDKAMHRVQLVVIKPLKYRLTKTSKACYRQPAFLLCTDPELALEQLLQWFLWRWDIECNFRDEKTVLGVGQAQVTTEASNRTAPALAVAAYALLLMASIQTYGPTGAPDRINDPKWYRRPPNQRATTNELINQLRFELWAPALSQQHFHDFSHQTIPNQKSRKCPLPLAAAAFLSLK
jgi:hypothetical protein